MIKESVHSLRLLLAVYAIFWCYSIVLYVMDAGVFDLSFFEILSLVIAGMYLYFAVTLKQYLTKKNALKPIVFVVASLLFLLVLSAFNYFTQGWLPDAWLLADVFIVVVAAAWMWKLAK